MSQEAKWWPDPFGRFEQRYFDGSKWTAHVISNGEQTVDPLGTSVTVPIATPTSAQTGEPLVAPQSPVASTDTSNATTQLSQFLDNFGVDARTRPAVRLTIALAGVGGSAAAVGLAAAIIGGSDTSRGKNITAAVVIVAIAYAIRLGVKTQPELRSAAVGAAILGIPGLAATIADGGDGGGALTLAAFLLIVAWALPGMRGRPSMLGAGAVALVLALTTVGDTSTNTELFDLGPADIIGGQTWLFVLVGIAFLGVIWWLDAHGYNGVGTSLVAAAILATALAVLKVVQNLGSTGGALLLTVGGLVVAIVGDHGQRRASTWFGVAVAAIGTIAVFFSALEPKTTGDIATTLILSGLILIVAPGLVMVIRASRNRQAEPGLPPPSGESVARP